MINNFFKVLFTPITAPLEFIGKHFKALVFIAIIIGVSRTDGDTKPDANLAKIYLDNAIMNADDILEKIEKAQNNTKYKGVLFVINSPGGAVPASVEIAYAIKRLNAVKPVVVYANGTLASGSYYSAIWAEKIIANPGSMVGSIGVILSSPDMSELMKKIGIKTRSITAGKYKSVGNPMSIWQKHETDELQKVIDGTYNMFVKDVANARKLKVENHKIYADAHIFTASQAKEVGLIDEVGTIYEATLRLKAITKVDKAIYIEIENKKEDDFKSLIKDLTAQTILDVLTNMESIK